MAVHSPQTNGRQILEAVNALQDLASNLIELPSRASMIGSELDHPDEKNESIVTEPESVRTNEAQNLAAVLVTPNNICIIRDKIFDHSASDLSSLN